MATTDPDDAVRFYTTVFGWEHEAIPTSSDPYHMFMHDGAYVAACVRQDADAVANEVNTPDMAATAGFLEQTFGVETVDVPMVESGYKTFNVGREPRGGILQTTEEWEGVPPHWMTYFAVDDTDATCAAILDAGGAVSVEPFDTALGRAAVVNDPQGAVFMVRG